MQRVWIPIFLLCALAATACNEAGKGTSTADSGLLSAADAETAVGTAESSDEAEITPIDASSDNDAVMASYGLSSFSKYVYTKNGEKIFLIDFNFFPEGTDFDSQGKTATLPCNTEVNESGATVDISAGDDDEGCDAIVVDLSSATFTFVGLEFTYTDSLDVFVDPFEFKITPDGIADAADGEILDVDVEDANLENSYNAAMDRRM